MLRTHNCGELRAEDSGKKVKLCGWVDSVRSYGKLNFIDLRDRYGKTQIVIKGKIEVKPEYCIGVFGEVKIRKKGSENNEILTGDIEVVSDKIDIFNSSLPLPFEIGDESVGEEVRMKYRYLDLRGKKMQRNLLFRSRVAKAVRDFLLERSFVEIETPILVKPTPEGARDYVVPSRVNSGRFYALPQSPQLYKQILMISGFDKYFQLARCLRDEDLRKDRQPEHTQIDMEMSFVSSEDIMSLVEEMIHYVFDKVLGVKLNKFVKLSYEDAMKKYKTDKPDLRKDKKNSEEFAFCWICDFPLFAYDEKAGKWAPEHHIFSMPKKEFIENLEKDPGKVKGELFDLVLNGIELGSGSIRVNSPKLQERIMKIIGMTKEEAREKFGFLLDAYEYGGPVHGGIGVGFDRMVALMLGTSDIREVIAFPKNKAAQGSMDCSPAKVDKNHIKELHIKIDVKKK